MQKNVEIVQNEQGMHAKGYKNCPVCAIPIKNERMFMQYFKEKTAIHIDNLKKM